MNQTINQNSKKTMYTVVGVIAIVVIILIIKAISGGDDTTSTSVSSTASSTASTTADMSSKTTSSQKTGAKASTAMPLAPALTDAEINTIIRSSFIRVPTTGVDVFLVNGGASYTNGPSKGRVEVGPNYTKVATNDGYDVFVGMTLTDSEKQASLNYVALFHLNGKQIRYTSAVLVGDRLPVVAVVSSPEPKYPYVRVLPYMDSDYGYRITINYLGRKNLEPVSALPTVPNDMIVGVKSHIIGR